jgi:hypothetical protein
MSEQALEMYDTLGRALLWGAIAVLGLALIGAIAIATTESSIPGLDELTRENRGIVAVGALAGGIAAAGGLAGIGALLRLKVAEHRRAET